MDDDNKSWGKGNDSISWLTQRTPCIVVAPERSAHFGEWWQHRRQYGLILPARRPGEDSTIPRARFIKQNLVDFDVAKSWIEACKEQHGDTCGGGHPTFASLRVIDCRRRTIVPAPIDCEYMALSYVWGPTHQTVAKDLSDWAQVPALIQDAITATICLGYNYLWVDYYSIPQDDPAEKDTQIQNMDKIYSEAQVTIVAACSEDASTGLSGVGSKSRQCSIAADAGQNTLIAIHSKEVDSIGSSKWDTRGWTYQEGLLSRRRLVFTDTGVFYQCIGGGPDRACATESFDVKFGTEGLRCYVNDRSAFPNVRSVTENPAKIWDFVHAYTKKSLSYDSDVLNAFIGILNSFVENAKEFDHLWGLPVYQRRLLIPLGEGMNSITNYKVRQRHSERLVSSLIWQPVDVNKMLILEHRADFPTWSWTSMPGGIENNDENIRNLDLDISIEVVGGGKMHAEEYFSMSAKLRPKAGLGLWIDAPVTYVQVHPLLCQDGLYHSVTSFERQDSRQLRYADMMSLHRWPEGFKVGRHLAIILGASQKSRSLRLTYHLMILQEKEGYYQRAFVVEVNDATLELGIQEETWASSRDEACEVLGITNCPWPWADYPADLGFEEEKREDWEKAFLIAKHLRVEQRVVYVR